MLISDTIAEIEAIDRKLESRAADILQHEVITQALDADIHLLLPRPLHNELQGLAPTVVVAARAAANRAFQSRLKKGLKKHEVPATEVAKWEKWRKQRWSLFNQIPGLAVLDAIDNNDVSCNVVVNFDNKEILEQEVGSYKVADIIGSGLYLSPTEEGLPKDSLAVRLQEAAQPHIQAALDAVEKEAESGIVDQ